MSLIKTACLTEKTDTNFNVYGLIRPGIEPTTPCTHGEHANHYTTEAVFITRKDQQDYQVFSSLRDVGHVSGSCRCLPTTFDFSKVRNYLRLVWKGDVLSLSGHYLSTFLLLLWYIHQSSSVKDFVHAQSSFIHSYLGDSLINNLSVSLLENLIDMVIQLLQRPGFQISWKKSDILLSHFLVGIFSDR